MLKINDLVRVIGTTLCGEEEKELLPIGGICKVVGIKESENSYKIVPADNDDIFIEGYWYHEESLEKGHIEWVKD